MGNRFTWRTATPESQGMSTQKLNALWSTLAARGTKTFLVIRGDLIIYEWYAPDYGRGKRHYTASLAKAVVGGLSLMLALDDGCIGIDDSAWKYISAWKEDPQKSQITIRHLATHSSGIEDAAEGGLPHDQLPGWKGLFWKRDPDPFTIARDDAPVIFPPGSDYAYSNPGMAMLAYAVTASLGEAQDIRTLLRERIMRPIGVSDDEWLIGYGETYELDGLKLVANWGGGSYTARAVARVGRLMLRKGDWGGQQLISPEWVEKAVAYAGTPPPERPVDDPRPGSGLGWWTNFDGVWEAVPRDAFAGAGAGNQILLAIPSLDLIVVRNGSQLGETFWGGLEAYLFNPLMEALVAPPYRRSGVIRSVTFAPVSEIVRKARGMPGKNRFDGSDNWPLTWADDDNQYTAYGDGYGFEPYTDKKLGLGFAKIVGDAERFQGVNIRSESGERLGGGANSPKASGMLMVEGALYMWARNTNNSQLAWSTDYAQTWTWSDWKFTTGFGCPTFLNFGGNYASARDEYVYIYSQDADDAYTPANRLVLARVPKDRIRDCDAYTFFKNLDVEGNPIWTADVNERGAVFTFLGRCYRSSVTYNAGLKRYLLCQILPGSDTRYEGGFGVYDAPEPWGPWTIAYFTVKWDVGPGETCSIPTRWMSADGKACYLVFSGDDAFSARKAAFSVGEGESEKVGK